MMDIILIVVLWATSAESTTEQNTAAPTTWAVTSPTDPPVTQAPEEPTTAVTEVEDNGGLSQYALIMIVVLLGIPVIVTIICLIRCFVWPRRKPKKTEKTEQIKHPEWIQRQRAEKQKSMNDISATISSSGSSAVTGSADLNADAQEKRLWLIRKQQYQKSMRTIGTMNAATNQNTMRSRHNVNPASRRGNYNAGSLNAGNLNGGNLSGGNTRSLNANEGAAGSGASSNAEGTDHGKYMSITSY